MGFLSRAWHWIDDPGARSLLSSQWAPRLTQVTVVIGVFLAAVVVVLEGFVQMDKGRGIAVVVPLWMAAALLGGGAAALGLRWGLGPFPGDTG